MRDYRLKDQAWRSRVGFDNVMTETELLRVAAAEQKVEKRKRQIVGGTR